jgi:RNA polymerase sigma factor (sigma-70 family)
MSKPRKLNDEQRKLVEDNLKLVHFVIAKSYPTFRGDEDIFQSGSLGLLRAALNWDESKCAFSTYAVKCINYAIKDELRERQRNGDTISLDCPIGDDLTLADTISDNEEVFFVDDRFVEKLNDDERFIFDLSSKGYQVSDIQTLTGYDSRKIRKILRIIHAKYKNTT